MKYTKNKKKNSKKLTRKKKSYKNLARGYQDWLKTLSPSRTSIPSESIAEAASSLIQKNYTSRLDKKFKTCGICLDRLINSDNTLTLTCSPTASHRHSFHKKCVNNLIEHGEKKCPSCRAEPMELNTDLQNIKREINYRLLGIIRNLKTSINKLFISQEQKIHDFNIIEDYLKKNFENKILTILTDLNLISPVNWSKISDLLVNTNVLITSQFYSFIDNIILLNNILFTQKKTIKKRIGKDEVKRTTIIFLNMFTNLYLITPWIGPLPSNLSYLIEQYNDILIKNGAELLSNDTFIQLLENINRTDIDIIYPENINYIKAKISTFLQI
jgi:hypothetical protein